MTKDISRLIEVAEKLSSNHRQVTFAPEYAEPGYSTDKGILFANWNPSCGFNVQKAQQKRDPIVRLGRIAEKMGFKCEWEYEWTTCQECGKAVRTSPDCYGWTSHYRIVNECELICLDCLDWAEYLESIEGNPSHACPPEIDPEQYGYVKYNGDFETGFHPGQTDDPKKVLATMTAHGLKSIVFRIAGKGQFDVTWQAYHKLSPAE